MKKVIDLSHLVVHEDRDITDEEAQRFLDSFIQLVESYGFHTIGSMKLVDIEE